jgi:endo-1,3(4)-beta-glucanase
MESTPLLPKSVTQPAANETQQTSKVNIFIGGVTLSVVFLFALIAAVRVHMSHSDNLMKVIPFPHISHPDPPSSLWGTVARPFPTGAFWTNVAIGKGDSPIGLYPYSVKCLEEGIQVGYGAATRHITQLSIYDDYVADMLLSSKEAYVSRGVDSYDFASVTMAYQTATGGGFKAPLVKGSAFVTVVYTKTTPVISSDLMHIVKFEKKEAPHGQPGVAYLVVLGNWMNWVVYCSEDVEFVKTGDKLVASKPIDGYVRIAYLPPFSTTALPLLLEYANRYPVGASFSYVTEDSTSILTYHFKSLGSGSLLMLALPHHVSLMVGEETGDMSRKARETITPLYCIKGKMTAVVGEIWRLKYELPVVDFDYDQSPKSPPTREQLTAIGEALKEDVTTVPVTFNDPYQVGYVTSHSTSGMI